MGASLSLSLLSHASSGRFALGNDWISKGNLGATASAWTHLSTVLTDDASINLYGCNLVDKLGDGQALINKLSKMTGAAVFASTDLTGRGGDWVLEASSRHTDRAIWKSAFNTQQLIAWDGDLVAVAQGGETLVNTTTSGTQSLFLDNRQAIAMDTNGNYVVVWVSADASGNGVFAQRYNSAGVAQGGEFRVNTTTANAQQSPAVAMDNAGNFVVTWTSSLQDGSGNGVYAQRYTAAGVAQGGEFRVNTATNGAQELSTIAMDAGGDFVIAWQDNTQESATHGIYAQLYNAAGVAQGGEFHVNTFTAGDQQDPVAAMDASGDFVIAWMSNSQDGSSFGIYAQRYNAAGVAQGAEFRVNTTTANAQSYPTLAMDAAGNFAIAWMSNL